MRPVTVEHVVSQYFASMATEGVVGDINADQNTPEYWVGRYGNYQPFGHAGMDFACPIGTKVRAMADGVVLYAGWGYNLPGTGPIRAWLLYANFPGIVTVIQHPGWIGVYAHLSDNDMAPAGTRVKMGQVIGLSGNTGGVDAHLHVEALVDLSYKTGDGLIYGRTDPSRFFGAAAIAPQGTTTTLGELSMADIDSITKQLATLLERTAPINTDAGATSLRQFIADGTRAAQKAADQTAPINVSGGQEGIRDFIAKGTRASQASAAKLAGLEAALKAVVAAAGSPIDLAAVTAAAEAGATKALSNLSITIEQGGK